MFERLMRERAPFASTLNRWLAGLLLSSVCCLVQAENRSLQDCADCPVMVIIPAGKFMMGHADDVLPVHQVTLNYQFAIGRTEVTEAQFRIFLERTGYNAGPGRLTTPRSLKRPAVDVDWYAASAYARWLSRYTAKRYRLPSEAEWDYAAHAGTSARYWWGDSAADGCGKEHLPTLTEFIYKPCASSPKQDTIDVASLTANPWGLYDMVGNAGEWMLDCPNELDTYAGAPQDGAPFMGCGQFQLGRVMRGRNILGMGAAQRRVIDPSEHSAHTGFRVVRELP